MTTTDSITGGCQCGEVRYRLTGEPVFLAVCHCLECQRQSGSAFGMSLRMRVEDVDLHQGTLKRWSRASDMGADVTGCFCGTCGTRIWHEPTAAPGFVHIKPGTLDDPSRVWPRHESWTTRKAGWLTLPGLDASFRTQPKTDARP